MRYAKPQHTACLLAGASAVLALCAYFVAVTLSPKNSALGVLFGDEQLENTAPLVALRKHSARVREVQNAQSIFFDAHTQVLCANASCVRVPQRDDFEAFIHFVSELDNGPRVVRASLAHAHARAVRDLNLTHHFRASHAKNVVDDYRYGEWCGVNYGGFESPCRSLCMQDLWNPTPACVQCRPPTDYTDQVCMLHDFCQERFQHLHNGSAVCARSDSLSQFFPTPCNCSLLLITSLSLDTLLQKCYDLDCVANGVLIRATVDNGLVPCGCTYTQCSVDDASPNGVACKDVFACVSATTCAEFGGDQ